MCSRGEFVVCGDAEESMSSAAEFVEGGAQDPCDDACSICLESFCDDDPATVSGQSSGLGFWMVLTSWSLEVVDYIESIGLVYSSVVLNGLIYIW